MRTYKPGIMGRYNGCRIYIMISKQIDSEAGALAMVTGVTIPTFQYLTVRAVAIPGNRQTISLYFAALMMRRPSRAFSH